jgi:hypothetical protein
MNDSAVGSKAKALRNSPLFISGKLNSTGLMNVYFGSGLNDSE